MVEASESLDVPSRTYVKGTTMPAEITLLRSSFSTSHPTAAGLLALLCLLVFPLGTSARGDGPPSEEPVEVVPALAFEEAAVTVSGATPEGGVVVFGMGREWTGYTHHVLRMEHLLTADADGALRWELEEGLMPRSVWAAVDLVTGEYTLASPAGHTLERVEPPAEGLGANARFLEHEGRYLDLLLVRPASKEGGEETAAPEETGGFWGIALGDGAGLDRDGEADSRMTVDLLDLQPLGDSSVAPERLRPKDVVIGVDPQSLQIYAKRLADGPDEGSDDEGSDGGNDGAGNGQGGE